MLFSSLLHIIFNNCVAQTPTSETAVLKKDAQLIKNNKLIVILLDEDKKYISKLTKKGNTDKLKEYSDAVNAYNSNIKELATKYLTLPKELSFKYFSEIKEMPVDERRSCSFLAYGVSGRLGPGDGVGSRSKYTIFVYDLYRKEPSSPIEEEGFHFNKSDVDYCKFEIYIYKKGEMEPVFDKPSYHLAPTKADMSFFLMRVNKVYEAALNDEAANKNKKKQNDPQILKEKVLAICKDDLSKKATETAIKAKYPYSFQLMSKEEIDAIFLNKNEKYLVLMYVPEQDPLGGRCYQEIFDISSAEIIDNIKVDPGK